MEIEKSRNGYYTLTFFNKSNLEEKEIFREFSTVGNVCKIIQNFQRVFIRFKEKEEAERALKKFGKVYDLDMAKNNKISDSQQHDGIINQSISHNSHKSNQNCNKPIFNQVTPSLASPGMSTSDQSIEKLNSISKMSHLILGNLPKNYTTQDVNALVEEANPVYISQLDDTRVFNIKFCHVVLNSAENLTYLINKLNGFVISGEKLIAAEVQHLLEWRTKAFEESGNRGRMIYKRYYKEVGTETNALLFNETVDKCKEMRTFQVKAPLQQLTVKWLHLA